MVKTLIFFLALSFSLHSNIYVINHEERPDKWEKIQRHLEKENLQANRFIAINGDHFSQKKKKELCRKYKLELKAHDLGQFLTQLEIIKEAYKKGLESVQLIDEDTTELKPFLTLSKKDIAKIVKEPGQLLKYQHKISTKSGHICSFETPVIRYLKPIQISESRSGLEPIDCIYVINLDARTDKWDRLKPLFEEKKLKVNRFSAINGWKFTKEDKKALAGPYRPRLRGGQLGCLLSHVSILKDAHERGFDLIWVLEDDIDFFEEPAQIAPLVQKLNQLDPDWDIFYTDSDCTNEKGEYFTPLVLDPRPDQELPSLSYFQERMIINDDLMQIRSRFATHSMLISKKGIDKILNYFTHVYLYSPIDWDLHYIPNICQYATRTDIVTKWRNNLCSDTIPTSSLNQKIKK